jgi:radical SAM superfamily enzyme YgiQ (UPF0313 family)
MPKVLLIQPPIEDFFTTPIRLYPLGLLYVARVFELLGFEVEILDCLNPLKKTRIPLPEKFSYLQPYLDNPYFFQQYWRFGWPLEKIITRVREFSPDLIGISCSFAAYYRSLDELARALKTKFSIPIILGGNQASCLAEQIKAKTPEIDEVIRGQAEISLPVYLRENYAEKSSLEARTAEESHIDWKDLWPAHHVVNPDYYRIGQKNYVSLQASRGCPQNCSFCNVHLVFGRKVDYRPVASVIEEMRWAYLHREVRIFNFEDDNLSFDREWLVEFLLAVSRDQVLEGIELTFMNGLGYENLDEDILWLMRQAGVRKLDLAWVSGNPTLRQKYHRPQKKDETEFMKLLQTARKLGFFVTVYLILGLPGQTKEEIVETTEKLLKLDLLVGPSVFYLTPGCELHRSLNLPAELKDDWDMYRSTAFAVETEHLKRENLIELFLYIRKRNLEKRFCKMAAV